MQKRRNVPVGASDEKEEKSQVYLYMHLFILPKENYNIYGTRFSVAIIGTTMLYYTC